MPNSPAGDKSPLLSLQHLLEQAQAKRERDAHAFAELDFDECMICHAYGDDKRGFFLDCGYAVEEVVPEALDIRDVEHERGKAYFLNLCKMCRGEMLGALEEWANRRRALRLEPKDHDGYPLFEEDDERNIPVRARGAIYMLTAEEYESYRTTGIPEVPSNDAG